MTNFVNYASRIQLSKCYFYFCIVQLLFAITLLGYVSIG